MRIPLQFIRRRFLRPGSEDKETTYAKIFSTGARYLFPRPLEVGGKNEADIRIRILVNDSLRLLLVLQHIVDPIQGELLRLHGVFGLVF